MKNNHSLKALSLFTLFLCTSASATPNNTFVNDGASQTLENTSVLSKAASELDKKDLYETNIGGDGKWPDEGQLLTTQSLCLLGKCIEL